MKCKECEHRTVRVTANPCNECKHRPPQEYDHFEQAEPKVLTAEGLRERQKIPDEIRAADFSIWNLKSLTDRFYAEGKKSGQNCEYQRPEQVELRQSFENLLNKAKCFMDEPNCNDFTVYIQHAEMVIDNLKPPTEHTEKEPVVVGITETGPGMAGHVPETKPAPESEKVLTSFQEWDTKEPVNPDPIHNENWHRRRGRKEGWNSAVNAVLSRITDVEDNSSPMLEIAGYFRKSFKELIEK